MRRLSTEETTIRFCDADHVIIGAHENERGYMHHTKVAVSDLPNDLAGLDDLKRAGIEIVDGSARMLGFDR